jgi:hypothetical protein
MATTEKTTLASAMASAFRDFEAASKDANNPHFKSKYATLSAVIDAVKPALTANRLFFTQASHDSDHGVCVETIIHHESGDSLSCGKLFVPASKQDAQGFGSALTYARRYSLMTAFGIPAEDDDGNAAVRTTPAANDRNGNGHAARRTEARDAPFPQGPAKNKTELKTLGRTFWREIEGCGDPDELDALIRSHGPLQKQIAEALPDWWSGGTKDGEPYDGLSTVILKKQTELSIANPDWRANPILGG